jgi:hypothetical protein
MLFCNLVKINPATIFLGVILEWMLLDHRLLIYFMTKDFFYFMYEILFSTKKIKKNLKDHQK